MATISSAGIGSGLDVESIITKLMTVEKQPLTKLTDAATVLTSKVSAFAQIKSAVSSLSDAANVLAGSALWAAKTATSSNTSAITASISNATTATATSFTLAVQKLALAQSVSTGAVSTGSVVGAGTISLTLGDWDSTAVPPTFSANSATPTNITVAATDSMTEVAAKINASSAGVTATVLSDSTGQRLLLQSKTTGESQGFKLDITDADGDGDTTTGLSRLGVDMSSSSVVFARDAQATVNGQTIKSASNTLTDALPGLTINLLQETTSNVTVSVATDTSGMKTAIQNFVVAFNGANSLLAAATKYDPSTKQGALLQGDSTTTSLQIAIRGLAGASMSQASGTVFSRLSDLGVAFSKAADGSLTIDSTKLDTALKNPTAVRDLFVADTGNDNTKGIALKFKTFLTGILASDGSLATKTASLEKQQKSNTADQDTFNTRLSATETRLRAQYSALDGKMASLTALDTYVKQQIAQWNKSTS